MIGPSIRWELTLDDLVRLPAEAVAFQLLAALPERQAVWREHTFDELLEASGAEMPQIGYRSQLRSKWPAQALALAEAWSRLESLGLIVQWPPYDPRYEGSSRGAIYQLTRLGREMRKEGPRAEAVVHARRRIGLELHPTLSKRLRNEVAVGAFETATSNALRAVEARVRRLAGEPKDGRGKRLVGRALMQYAFRPGGPLADPSAEEAEQQGTMELFAGTFGAVRNVLAHTEVEWPDPTEAAEYVLLADLLMRLLDRVEEAVQGP